MTRLSQLWARIKANCGRSLLTFSALALAGCSTGGACGCPAVCPTPSCSTSLQVAPASYSFSLDNNAPEVVSVGPTIGALKSLTLSVADPTIVGVTSPIVSDVGATFSVIPISRGATTITATDQTGASGFVSVATAECGRPPSLLAAQQVVPASGSKGVASSLGTAYFVAYFANGTGTGGITPGNLHIIVGAHGTLEGGAFAAAPLPAGVSLPSPLPISGATSTIVAASVPTLTVGQTYTTQLYNDTCQPAVLAGSFST